MKRAATVALGVLLAIAAGSFALAAWSQGTPPNPNVPVDNVEICHKPPAPKRSEVSVDSIIKGQGHDSDDTDIIPPFKYDGGTYPGKNWDLQGQATWYYDCDPARVPDVTPTVQCVEQSQGGLLAHFGYHNSGSTVQIEVGLVNRFDPAPENRSQPVTFENGTHTNVVQVPFTGSLTWVLAGRSVTASGPSPDCPASIRIDKALLPDTDQGKFDLLLDGTALARGVGHGGTTDTQPVTANGSHTVSERAAEGTSLAAYDTTIVCRDNGGAGAVVAQGAGVSLGVTPKPGQALVCVIQNARKKQPGPGQVDLQIVKQATPPSVLVGGQVTWRVRVTNKGPDVATNVVINDSLPDDVSYVGGSLVVSTGVTCIGARCTYARLPVGESISGRFVTTATAVGQKTNTVTVRADENDTNLADNAASAQVLVTGRDEEVVSPILECVDAHSDGTYRAHFGYLNEGNAAVTIDVGPRNSFTPAPEDRGQPTHFQPGRAPEVFQVDFTGTIVWTLTGRTSTASANSKRCAATSGTLRVDKVLRPASDPGSFNLEIDGVPAGSGRGVGDLGTTGDVSVTPGKHRVGEEGVKGTSLADYDTTIACRGNRGRGAVSSAFAGPELVVDVPAGAEVVCTITNTRRSGPPVPPPEPPPAPTPPPAPQPGTADLSVQKFVDRRVGRFGDIVTWTIVVTNSGALAATGATITDRAAAGATIVSLQMSQGTCGKTTCALGTIAPGASVRIVARTRALRVGARLNTVTVRGDQPDSVLLNNVASALIRIVSSFRPPLQERCSGLSIDRRVTLAGTSVRVRARVRNVFGKPLAGTVVRARGAGTASSASTNALGVARLRLAPSRAGIVRFTVDARTLTAAGAKRCTASVGVLRRAAIQPGVTG